MADIGIKISQEGINAGTADIQDLILDSRVEGSAKVAGTISKTISPYSFGTTAHGLGYPPMFTATVTMAGTTFQAPVLVPNGVIAQVYATDENIICYSRGSFGGDLDFKIVYFAERVFDED